ncbi:MAG: non-ribosomal peptide synthetase, partial [Acidobacteria bacterium]
MYPDLVLSAAQLGVWVAQKLDPTSPIFNLGQYVDIRGSVDSELLERALRQVVDETETLRVVLREGDSGPRQTIRPSVDWQLQIIDMGRESDPVAAAQAWMRGDLARPVDLRDGQLFAYALLRVSPGRAFWYQRNHHIVNDGFGGWLVTRRVAEVYSRLQNRQSPTGSPFLPLLDLLEDERTYRASNQFERDKRYWIDSMGGAPEPVSLGSRPATGSGIPIRRTVLLPASVTNSLRQIAYQTGATLTQVVSAALATYLYRMTGSTDAWLGLTVAGRIGAVARRTPGMMSDVLPVRVTLGPELPFGQVVQQISLEHRRVLKHQRFRSEDIRRSLGLLASGRKLYGPIVNAMPFDYDLRFGRYRATTHNLANGPVDDLAIAVYDQSDSGTLRLDFDAYPAVHTVDDLAAHERRFLRCLKEARVTEPIWRMNLLDQRERQQVLVKWNDTGRAVEQTMLPALIEAQVARKPKAIALVFGESTFTYHELNRRANQVAHRLIELGVGPETCVAIAAPRSVEMVVGLIGILKSGAAYLPIDPEYPSDRLALIVGDARPPVILTVSATAARVPRGDWRTLMLDRYEDLAAGAVNATGNPRDEDRIQPLRPQHPAYIIYTSGSTGRPKGVTNTHAGIVNRLRWMQAAYGLTSQDRVLQKTPFGFDVSVWEFFWPLLEGATLVVARPGGHRDAGYLAELIRQQRITTVHFVPSMLQAFLLEPSVVECSTLRRVICSGEALSPELQTEFQRKLDVPLHNLYGPTEAAVDVTFWECQQDGPPEAVPIGRPIWNTNLYVLDAVLQPTPVEVGGELYIAGVGLARGYLNRPALTAERFVADPYGDGTRMYRTGDLARWRAGVLEYLGRSDHQVKIRGFRIELGEVETAILRDPEVAQAVVVAREYKPGDRRLVGYVVPAAGVKVDADALRESLAQVLPDYLVPAAIVSLDALPLSANGKLDRKALPAPDFTGDQPSRLPRTPQEEAFCSLFAEILGVPRVGVDDSFFELGGDSILAIQLVSRARRRGLALTTRDIFQHPTVAALVTAASTTHATAGIMSVDDGVGSVVPTPIMRRLLERDTSCRRISQSMLLQVPADLGEGTLVQGLQTLLDHHDALRLRVRDGGLEVRPRESVRASECLRVVDAGEAIPAEEAGVAEMRLDPDAGVMLQAVWFRPGRLRITIHHLAVDAVSWRILIADLASACQDAGRPLCPCGTSFRGWAARLNQEARRPERTGELAYWTDMLREPVAPIFRRKLDPRRDTAGVAGRLVVKLAAKTTEVLLGAARTAFRARTHEILLASFAAAVTKWRRRRDRGQGTAVRLDLEGHGREEIFEGVDLSRTVGWFTSVYPVHLEASPSDPTSVLKQIKEQLRHLPDNGIGYGLLRYLNQETARALSELPASEICFNYLGRIANEESTEWGMVPEAESFSGSCDPEMPLNYGLELNALILDGTSGPQLSVTLSWAPALVCESEVRDLAESWFAELDGLAREVARPGAGGLTPSDVPLVALTQSAIDRLEAKHGRIDEIQPLSPLQEGLLFHSLYDRQAADLYTVQLIVGLEGPLDPKILRTRAESVL